MSFVQDDAMAYIHNAKFDSDNNDFNTDYFDEF